MDQSTTWEDVEMSSGQPTPVEEQASVPFRQAKICVAIDVSGSTYGSTLEAEKRAISSVCSLIPQSMHGNITILPWHYSAEKPRPFSELQTLESGGGTDPSVILEDAECRLALQEAGFWFLMTDGEIEDTLIRRFARNLTDYGIHGKACIISVFGERLRRPSDCNITVGLSVFAVSPHVAFLYTDVETNKTSLLSTKGCFSNLLPAGQRNPTLDYGTRWDDLPRVSYENLTRVSVPPAQRLENDEIILQGNTRVSIPQLLAQEKVDENIMRQIMLSEDNIKTVALTAKLRGESDKLGKWLDRVEEKLDQDSHDHGVANATGSRLLRDAEARFALSETGDQQDLELDASQATAKPLAQPSKMSITNPSASSLASAPRLAQNSTEFKLRSSASVLRTMSSEAAAFNPRSSLGSVGFEHLDSQSPVLPQPRPIQSYPIHGRVPASEVHVLQVAAEPVRNSQDRNLNLAVTGFLRPTLEKDQLLHDCSSCKRSRSVLTLVLKAPPQLVETKDFPPVGSTSKLVYPLTMGNYPETDIISDIVVCDSCAAAMARSGVTPSNEIVTAVLPLVSCSKNQDAWLQTLNIATNRRFNRSDLPQVFLGILFSKIERLVSDPSKLPDLQEALRWEANMIQSEVVLQSEKFLHVNRIGAGLISEVLLRNFRDTLSPEKFPLLLSYPLDGFIVANAALSNSKCGRALSIEKRKTIVFLRFLYHLLENCHAYEQENGPVQLHAAKMLILVMDGPSGPRSLFRWGSLRQFSFAFEKLEDFRKYLSDNTVVDRYRLSLPTADLLDTPLLTAASLADFRRLGSVFNWIESEAGHSIAVFVHYLMRLDVGECTPSVHFQKLRENEEVKEALLDPGALSARSVEQLIKPLKLLE